MGALLDGTRRRHAIPTLALAILSLIASILVAGPSAAATTTPVAELTVYSDGTAIGDQGSAGVIEGHAFITVKNTSSSKITVGKLAGVMPQDVVSVGTWGNKDEHHGVWYNLESWYVHHYGAVYATASLTMSLSSSQLSVLNKYIAANDGYNAVTNNCSSFASEAWNSVAPWSSEVYAGVPPTPAGLMWSISQNGSAEYGTAQDIPWNALGVWYGNGKRAPVRSTSFPDAAPNITFSENPVGTSISDQYAAKGVLFSGTPGPVIATDGTNPTSPVLSPGPGYSGAIDISFVDSADPSKAAFASAIAFDVGYMDAEAGASISWYSSRGKLLGQQTTSGFGMVRVSINPVGGAARVRIDTTGDPAGAAIDNLQFAFTK